MRGKNIIWLCFSAMLLSTLVVSIGTGAANTKLYITPTVLPAPGVLGHPGDEYTISINVDDVTNLWSWGFEIHIAPYASVLNPEIVPSDEGDFLVTGWEPDWTGGGTYFAFNIDSLNGIIYMADSRLEKKDPFTGDPLPREGASGSGNLVTFKLTVLEAGSSPIELVNTYLLDINGDPISHKATGSEYNGAYARLVRVNMPDGRRVTTGDTFTINTRVKNEGDVPLLVRVRFDIDREDGRRVVIRPGQTYLGGGLGEPPPFPPEFLYINEFNELYHEWDNPPENAFGTPDGLYIEGTANAQWSLFYGFDDLDLAGRAIGDISITGYCQQPNGYNEGADIDVYGFTSVTGFGWMGSLWGTDAWGWHGVRWTTDLVTDVMPELRDVTELNNFEMLIYNYHGDAPDVLRVDSIQLRVDFAPIVPFEAPIFTVDPYTEMDLEAISWVTLADHEGTYDLTATIEYSYDLTHWNAWGSKTKTLSFEIAP